jgi:AmmeMemoRadiSam system protein B
VDEELVEKICAGLSLRRRGPAKFPDDNTLELQYPFVKHFFPESQVVVCGVAPSFFAAMAGTLVVEEARRLGRSIRVIGSTDMTHYGPDFGFTPAGRGQAAVDWVTKENDPGAIAAMIAMDSAEIIDQGLNRKNMCCAGAASAAAAAARKMGAVRGTLLDYATSFDRSASDSFVGYAGILYAVP